MFTKLIFFVLLFTHIHANSTLNATYYINSNDIYISNIIKDAPRNKLIYKLEINKYTKRIKSKELLKILKENGYRNITSKSSYVKFIKKSPVDTSKIALFVKEYYTNKYDKIDIKTITIEPRSYITSLPSNYTIEIRQRNYLSRSGVVSIKTPKNRKIFFNYDIDATVWVYFSRKPIKKDVELTSLNTVKKSITLDKFMAKPIENLKSKTIQGKHNIKKDRVITSRDIETISLVKKNSYIHVNLYSQGMAINFSAKALQSGKLNDIISVRKRDGKRLKVRVVGKNRAEMK